MKLVAVRVKKEFERLKFFRDEGPATCISSGAAEAASHPTLANFMTFVVATLAFFNLGSRFAGLINDVRFTLAL